MKSAFKAFSFFALVLLTVSCTVVRPDATDVASPLPNGTLIQVKQPNMSIRLVQIDGITKLKKNELLVLDLLNDSQDVIRFQPDFGIRVFIQKNSTWTPARNNYGYASEDVLLGPKGKENSDAFVPLFPIVDSSNSPVTIRVTVTGTIDSGNEATSTRVTAETELTLQP